MQGKILLTYLFYSLLLLHSTSHTPYCQLPFNHNTNQNRGIFFSSKFLNFSVTYCILIKAARENLPGSLTLKVLLSHEV